MDIESGSLFQSQYDLILAPITSLQSIIDNVFQSQYDLILAANIMTLSVPGGEISISI